jgi:hypothetical protein
MKVTVRIDNPDHKKIEVKQKTKFCIGGTEREVVIYDVATMKESACLKKSL